MLAATCTSRPSMRNGSCSAATMRPATRLGVGRAERRLDQHGELVAAEPGHRVAVAHRRAQPVGDLDQQLVAGRVAEAVVDLLEAVQVEEQHGHVVVVAAARRSASASRSRNSARLASPVSASWYASCTSWSCSSLRSRMSRVLSTRPSTLGSSSRFVIVISACRLAAVPVRARSPRGRWSRTARPATDRSAAASWAAAPRRPARQPAAGQQRAG